MLSLKATSILVFSKNLLSFKANSSEIAQLLFNVYGGQKFLEIQFCLFLFPVRCNHDQCRQK